ncbi:RING/U-box [Glarea lozoyensis ATCC 20868]|uniref:RING/U-box n=1 Tax=Glarea lozoyensis (strain ATCC 20868 / MF5171) TaxID=1116229 RepID=S3DDE6_GLAL2|nr:RING/U-box [Glarea lozoyensis ATCC 20868]EPE36437.1 RING/U-box [Glarea lozoyensis ATCC 20868]
MYNIHDTGSFQGCIGNINCYLEASSPLSDLPNPVQERAQKERRARELLKALATIPHNSSFFEMPATTSCISPEDHAELEAHLWDLSALFNSRMVIKALELKSGWYNGADRLWNDAEQKDLDLFTAFCVAFEDLVAKRHAYGLRWEYPDRMKYPKVFEPVKVEDLEEGKGDCVICYCPLGKPTVLDEETWQEDAVKLPCGHIFGSRCLQKCEFKDWGFSCPYCRKEYERENWWFPSKEPIGPRYEEVDWILHVGEYLDVLDNARMDLEDY